VGGPDGFSDNTILVVDDAEAIRKMVCAMLTQSGYRCMEASDGTEALRLIEDGDGVKLVLTDMIMPRMGGPELAHHISRLRPDVRIIFMSGYTDDPIVRSVEHTPSIFLAKPFTTATLMEKIRQSLDRPWQGLPEVRMSGRSDTQ
jgi:CheY-like chemotaxis protein